MMELSKRVLVASATLCLALSGCASPGFPRAPSLHLPAPITDLTATRIADRVELHWTAPTSTTDGLDLTMPTEIEVCRNGGGASLGSESVQPPCTAILKAAGHAGPSSAVDRLPANLADVESPRQLLAYRVRVLNPSGRAALPTAVALVPAGVAPAPVESFRAVQEKDGVLLEWRKAAPTAASSAAPGSSGASDAAAVEVLRTDLTPKPAASTIRSSNSTAGGQKPQASNPFAPKRRSGQADPSAEIRLRADATGSAADASTPAATPLDFEGMIDQTALTDGRYSYRAQRVLTVALGGKNFEILSESTAPVTVAMRDTFPPAIPRGLVSVPSTISGTTEQPAGAGARATIDLSWQPNAEADLAGYLVYRTDLSPGAPSGGGPVRLTASPLPGPGFRDATVLTGHRYEYSVTAVDRSGNESARSAPIQDSPEGR